MDGVDRDEDRHPSRDAMAAQLGRLDRLAAHHRRRRIEAQRFLEDLLHEDELARYAPTVVHVDDQMRTDEPSGKLACLPTT